MKSYTAGTHNTKPREVNKKWYLIDAKDLILGRLGAEVAKILRGKNKADFTPNVDMGDNVVIINAKEVHSTSNPLTEEFHWHTGHPGGLKTRNLSERLNGKFPERVIEKTIERMMPKDSPLARKQMKNLYVYPGAEHKHGAQKPEVLDLASKNTKNKKQG